MESLVTLLVFSIAMLGLARLQARLWVNSGDLYSSDKAHLIARNIATINEISTIFPSSMASLLATQRPYIASDYNLKRSVYSSGVITASEVIVSWERPSGAVSIPLRSTFSSSPGKEDARWLLTRQ